MDSLPPTLQSGLLESFTDREEVISLFEKVQDTATRGQNNILSIKGNSGTGKTHLAEYLQQTRCESRQWSWGALSFAQQTPTFYPVIRTLSNALRPGIPEEQWLRYEEQRSSQEQVYMTNFVNIDQRINAESGATISNTTQSVTADFTHLSQDRLHVLRTQLTSALLDLARYCEKPCCLFIDGYERFEPDSEANPYAPDLVEEGLVGWFWDEVIYQLIKAMPVPLMIVTCGWNWPSRVLHERVEIKDFTSQHIHVYLEKVGLLPLPEESISSETEVVNAFMDLTEGHPLVLSMAATLFATFLPHDRTAEHLKVSGKEKISPEARMNFIHARLLTRLPEPHRTLLERAPLLRTFDQETLRVLLQHNEDQAALFNDRTYEAFLRYPFIVNNNTEQANRVNQFHLHELVRRIQYDTLRRLHPEICEQLHSDLAEYYKQHIETLMALEEKQEGSLSEGQVAEIDGRIFRHLTEFFYHALQVPETQQDIFEEWIEAAELFITIHRRQSATPTEGVWSTRNEQDQLSREQQFYKLDNAYFHDNRHGLAQAMLEIVNQLHQEGCLFFQQGSVAYGQYLALFATFLTREARYKDAQREMEHAIAIFQQHNLPYLVALCHNELFLIHRHQENLLQAAECLDLALKIFESERAEMDIANVLHNLALIATDDGQLDQAERYQREALRLFQEREAGPQSAMAQGNLGRIYHYRGDRDLALLHYWLAVNRFEDIQDEANAAIFLNNIGVVYREQEHFDQALHYLEVVEARWSQTRQFDMLALALINIADIYNIQQRESEAYEYFKRALEILKEEAVGGGGGLLSFIRAYRGLAYLHFQQKKWQEALQSCQDLLDLATRRHNPLARFIALIDIATFYSERKETAKAIEHFEQTIPILQEDDSTITHTMLAEIHQRLANEHRELRHIEQAIGHYEQACSYFQSTNQPKQVAQALLDFADLYRRGYRTQEAQQKFEEACAIFWKTGDMQGLMAARNQQGTLARENRKWSQALLLHEQALRFFRSSRDLPNWGLTLYYLGLLQSKQGLHTQALSFFQQALALQEQETNPQVAYATLYALGNACMMAGEEWKARHYFEQMLQRSQQSQDTIDTFDALIALGQLAIFSGNPSAAYPYLAQVLENEEAQEEQHAEAHYELGESSRLANAYTEAQEHYREAYQIWSHTRNRARYALAQVRLSQLLHLQGQHAQAVSGLEPVLRLCEQTPVPRAHVLALYTLGEIAEQQEQPSRASHYYQQALTLYGPEVPARDRALILAGTGKFYLTQGDFALSASYLYRALCAYESQGDAVIADLVTVLDALILCYQETGDQDKVLAYGKYRQRRNMLRHSRG